MLAGEVKELVDISLSNGCPILVSLISLSFCVWWKWCEGALVDDGPGLGLGFQYCLKSDKLAVEKLAFILQLNLVTMEVIVLKL